jgi:hypothetical protein
MSLRPSSEIRDVKGISTVEKQRIKDFLQGAVYCWCKNRNDEWFSIRDLMGGENFDWTGNPMIALYQKHINKGKNDADAISDAGKDAGWLLKKVVSSDIRQFETTVDELVRKYKWVI